MRKIKEEFDIHKLKDMGYEYDIMEAGYISEDSSTIVYVKRSPYQRKVDMYMPNAEEKHKSKVKELEDMGILE